MKKTFTPSVPVDFAKIKFYEIPYPFFAEWLWLVLETSKILQPGFQVDIPKKRLDWFNFPDREVFDPSGAAYTLRTASALLENGPFSIHVLAQYGYETIPGQYIIVQPKLVSGGIFSRNLMRDTTIDFEITLDEDRLAAVEEVFFVFQ